MRIEPPLEVPNSEAAQNPLWKNTSKENPLKSAVIYRIKQQTLNKTNKMQAKKGWMVLRIEDLKMLSWHSINFVGKPR
jgi:hypothetical protein